MEIEWSRLKARELKQLAERNAIVLIPVGATEQHGPHLPVQVDARLATEVTLRAARRVAVHEPVVVAPTIWCGLSEHHMDLGGTITLDFATFHALFRGICGSIVRHGFKRLYIVNGHGGNTAALQVITGELTLELDATIGCSTYWSLDEQGIAALLDRQKNILHAGEAETSMMLALVPELINTDELSQMHGPVVLTASGIAGVDAGAYRWRRISSRSLNGVIGDAATASAEKGERLLDTIAESLAGVLRNKEFWQTPV
jgi:creatinine amidohydrolase